MRGMDEVLRQKMSKRWRGRGEVKIVNMEVVGVGELVREKGRVGGWDWKRKEERLGRWNVEGKFELVFGFWDGRKKDGRK